MDLISALIVPAAIFIGWNIGANDAANAIGTVVGSNTVHFKKAVFIVVLFALLGAILQSHNTMKTVGNGIIPSHHLEENRSVVLLALIISGLYVSFMTIRGMPVSTSQALVGSMVGIGIALGLGGEINYFSIAKIGVSWLVAPVGSCILAYLIYRLILTPISARMNIVTFNRVFRALTLIGAMLISYNLGANNIGVAMGPLMGANVLQPVDLLGFNLSTHFVSAIMIGVALGLGASLFGGGVVTTIGKKITVLGPVMAFDVQLAAAMTVYAFVLIGIPVSTTQALVGAIVGVGLTKGVRTINTKTMRHILLGWFFTPTTTAVLTVILYKLLSIP